MKSDWKTDNANDMDADQIVLESRIRAFACVWGLPAEIIRGAIRFEEDRKQAHESEAGTRRGSDEAGQGD